MWIRESETGSFFLTPLHDVDCNGLATEMQLRISFSCRQSRHLQPRVSGQRIGLKEKNESSSSAEDEERQEAQSIVSWGRVALFKRMPDDAAATTAADSSASLLLLLLLHHQSTAGGGVHSSHRIDTQ